MKSIATLLLAQTLGGPARQPGVIVTLYALDPIASTLSLGDGQYGQVFQDDQAKNRNSDLDFGRYQAHAFSVAVEGGRVGAIVDLGSAQELQERYGYEETMGSPQGYASLRILEGQFVILKDRRANTVQPLKEASSLAQPKSGARAPVLLGHIYLVRVMDADGAAERIVKLLVLDHQPGASVTFRWSRLR